MVVDGRGLIYLHSSFTMPFESMYVGVLLVGSGCGEVDGGLLPADFFPVAPPNLELLQLATIKEPSSHEAVTVLLIGLNITTSCGYAGVSAGNGTNLSSTEYFAFIAFVSCGCGSPES